MKVLILGSGGREHALAWKIASSPLCGKVYVSPGNPGMERSGDCECVELKDSDEIINFSRQNDIDLVVIGPEDLLMKGTADDLRRAGISVFGPGRSLANLEGSKAFAKEFMKKYNVRTAAYETFSVFEEAAEYIEKTDRKVVIKASGLAQGKGVIIPADKDEALEALKELMVDKKFKDAGNTIVIEEFLEGRETSVLTIFDGYNVTSLSSVMDHKKIGEGETGPNTGGMGTISPSPYYTEGVREDFEENILYPTLKGLREEGFMSSACIFFGLMITDEGVKLLEYNLRFGDPEIQALTMRMEEDLLSLMYNAEKSPGKKQEGKKYSEDIVPADFNENMSLCFILSGEGYPESPVKGIEMELPDEEGIKIFYAGVSEDDGKLVSSGGRIVGVSAKGKDKKEIQDKIIAYLEKYGPQKTYFRRDIGNI